LLYGKSAKKKAEMRLAKAWPGSPVVVAAKMMGILREATQVIR
jgi:hypothetical protein